MKKIGGAWLFLTLAALAGLGIGVRAAWQKALSPLRPDAEAVVFQIERGAPLASITRDLEEQELIRSAAALEWYARIHDLGTRLRAGEYELSAALSSVEILGRLIAGPVKTYPVSLPEGLRVEQIAARLADAGLSDASAIERIALDPDSAAEFGVEGPTLEGYLFPETYRFPHGMEPAEVIRVLVDHFLALWKEIEPLARERGLSMREVVTLASIIEKETGAAAERPLIASVFHNRLRRGMRLESDPTTIYGIADFDGNLRRVHLEDETNPYNTYQISGLPPGPIANPGADSLWAVVRPAETDYLYFVSRNDGTHEFTSTHREHVNAVNRFQKKGRR